MIRIPPGGDKRIEIIVLIMAVYTQKRNSIWADIPAYMAQIISSIAKSTETKRKKLKKTRKFRRNTINIIGTLMYNAFCIVMYTERMLP